MVPFDPLGDRRAPVPVEIQADVVTGQLADGDEVEVSGVWDGDTLDADQIVNLSAGAVRTDAGRGPPNRKSPRDNAPKGGKARVVALAAVAGVIVLIAGSVLYFTEGFGIWTRPGPIVTPVSATVFSPDGAPDNPQKAGLAIDGNPDTGWSTVAYEDAVPFPKFIEGMGVLLHLAEPTALSAVTIDVSSTGTQVRSARPPPTPRKIGRHHRADPEHVTAAREQPH